MSGHKTYSESYLPNKSGYILELPDLRSRQKWNTAGIRRQWEGIPGKARGGAFRSKQTTECNDGRHSPMTFQLSVKRIECRTLPHRLGIIFAGHVSCVTSGRLSTLPLICFIPSQCCYYLPGQPVSSHAELWPLMPWLPLNVPQKLPGIIGSGRRLQRFMIAHWWILSFVLPLFIVNTTTQKKSSFVHSWISRVRYIFHYNDNLNTSRIAGGCSEDCRLAYQPVLVSY